VHHAAGHGVLDVDPEVAGEDLPAHIGVSEQPPGGREIEERFGDDLAEGICVGWVRGDHAVRQPAGRQGPAATDAHRRVPSLAGADWPVTAWAPRPIVA
jgi:hypothetical protein